MIQLSLAAAAVLAVASFYVATSVIAVLVEYKVYFLFATIKPRAEIHLGKLMLLSFICAAFSYLLYRLAGFIKKNPDFIE